MSRKLVGVEIGGESLGAYNDGSMPDQRFMQVESDTLMSKNNNV